MELKDKLRKLRVDKGLTQQKLADYLGVDRSTYAYYETGTTTPSIFNLQKMAQLYDVSVDILLDTAKNNNALRVASDTVYEKMTVTVNKDEYELLKLYHELSDERKKSVINLLKTFTE